MGEGILATRRNRALLPHRTDESRILQQTDGPKRRGRTRKQRPISDSKAPNSATGRLLWSSRAIPIPGAQLKQHSEDDGQAAGWGKRERPPKRTYLTRSFFVPHAKGVRKSRRSQRSHRKDEDHGSETGEERKDQEEEDFEGLRRSKWLRRGSQGGGV